MAIFNLTEKTRIVTDGMNFVPEIYVNAKNKEGEDVQVWKRYGYYINFKNAILELIEMYPIVFAESKEIKTMKDVLKELEILKEEIAIKVINELK